MVPELGGGGSLMTGFNVHVLLSDSDNHIGGMAWVGVNVIQHDIR